MPFLKMNIEDITHYSKRTQAGNVEQAGTSYDKFVSEMTSGNANVKESSVPVNVTIESAIQYFKDNATGDKRNLYTFTADILDKYRVVSRSAVSKAFEKVKEESVEDSVIEVDMSEE